MKFQYNDGGRLAAGFKGATRDCVTRAIAIAADQPYQTVYDALNEVASGQRCWKGRKGSSRTGLPRRVYENYLRSLGWRWVPTMHIGSGCTVHLKADELPAGRIIVALSRHVAAVIDGVLHDTHDSSREETRCVYGYYTMETL